MTGNTPVLKQATLTQLLHFPSKSRLPENWIRMIDPVSGINYFHNEATGEVVDSFDQVLQSHASLMKRRRLASLIDFSVHQPGLDDCIDVHTPTPGVASVATRRTEVDEDLEGISLASALTDLSKHNPRKVTPEKAADNPMNNANNGAQNKKGATIEILDDHVGTVSKEDVGSI